MVKITMKKRGIHHFYQVVTDVLISKSLGVGNILKIRKFHKHGFESHFLSIPEHCNGQRSAMSAVEIHQGPISLFLNFK